MQQVTAALIEKNGRILLALRRAGRHMGPKWELPGGKVGPGEDPKEALRRELEEEFGIRAQIGECLGCTRFRKHRVDLEVLLYRIGGFGGALQLREHREVRWVEPDQVEAYDLVDSDRKVIRKYRKALT